MKQKTKYGVIHCNATKYKIKSFKKLKLKFHNKCLKMNEEQCQHDEQVVVVEVVKVVKVEEQKEQEQEQSAQPLAPQEQDEPEIEIEDQVKTGEDEQLEIEEALQQKEELEQEEEEEEKQPEIEVEHEKQRETSTQQLEKEVEEKIIVDEWNEGPDKIAPADSLMSTSLTKPVKLRLSDPDSGIFPPISVYTLFRQTVAKKPDFVALAFKSNLTDAWTYWTYQHYWDMCNKAAKSFIKVNKKRIVIRISFFISYFVCCRFLWTTKNKKSSE